MATKAKKTAAELEEIAKEIVKIEKKKTGKNELTKKLANVSKKLTAAELENFKINQNADQERIHNERGAGRKAIPNGKRFNLVVPEDRIEEVKQFIADIIANYKPAN